MLSNEHGTGFRRRVKVFSLSRKSGSGTASFSLTCAGAVQYNPEIVRGAVLLSKTDAGRETIPTGARSSRFAPRSVYSSGITKISLLPVERSYLRLPR